MTIDTKYIRKALREYSTPESTGTHICELEKLAGFVQQFKNKGASMEYVAEVFTKAGLPVSALTLTTYIGNKTQTMLPWIQINDGVRMRIRRYLLSAGFIAHFNGHDYGKKRHQHFRGIHMGSAIDWRKVEVSDAFNL